MVGSGGLDGIAGGTSGRALAGVGGLTREPDDVHPGGSGGGVDGGGELTDAVGGEGGSAFGGGEAGSLEGRCVSSGTAVINALARAPAEGGGGAGAVLAAAAAASAGGGGAAVRPAAASASVSCNPPVVASFAAFRAARAPASPGIARLSETADFCSEPSASHTVSGLDFTSAGLELGAGVTGPNEPDLGFGFGRSGLVGRMALLAPSELCPSATSTPVRDNSLISK